MSDIKNIPEFGMTIEELYKRLEELAEKKLTLATEIMNIDAEFSSIAAIITVKAMKELGDTSITGNTLECVQRMSEIVNKQNKKVITDLEEGKIV